MISPGSPQDRPSSTRALLTGDVEDETRILLHASALSEIEFFFFPERPSIVSELVLATEAIFLLAWVL